MRVAILVIALFALTAFAQEEQYQPEVEYFGMPSKQQIGNGFKTAGNIAGKVSGPLKVTGAILNRLPPVQVGPVNSRVVGAGASIAGKVTGVASHGFNYIGNKLGGHEVEEEFEFIDEPQEYEVHYYIDNLEDLEDFNLPTLNQIKGGIKQAAAGALHTGANIAKGASQAANAVSHAATVISSGKGQAAKTLGTISKVSGGVSTVSGIVSAGAKFIPHPAAQGVSAGAGAVSKVSKVVSTATGQLSQGKGITTQIVRGIAGATKGLAHGASAASNNLNKAANKIQRGKRELEFFVDDSVEDFNLPNRQQIADNFHKAGDIAGTVSKVAGTVSKVAGKVSDVAGKASNGLHWMGNKIGGKEVEVENFLA